MIFDGEDSATDITVTPCSVDLEAPLSPQSYAPFSSTDIWATVDAFPAKHSSDMYYQLSSPLLLTPQSSAWYNHDSIMKDALEAASYAEYEGYDMGSAYSDLSRRWSNAAHLPGVHDVAPGLSQPAWY